MSEDDLAALLRIQGCEMLAMRDKIAGLESRLAESLAERDRLMTMMDQMSWYGSWRRAAN